MSSILHVLDIDSAGPGRSFFKARQRVVVLRYQWLAARRDSLTGGSQRLHMANGADNSADGLRRCAG